jgi:hypothetical protein
VYVSTHQLKYKNAKARETYVSARTIRVRLAFSMENFTLPPSPAIRPILSAIAEDNWDIHTDSSCEMVSVKGFDIFDLEGIEVDIV